jgi:hypothetical protein
MLLATCWWDHAFWLLATCWWDLAFWLLTTCWWDHAFWLLVSGIYRDCGPDPGSRPRGVAKLGRVDSGVGWVIGLIGLMVIQTWTGPVNWQSASLDIVVFRVSLHVFDGHIKAHRHR